MIQRAAGCTAESCALTRTNYSSTGPRDADGSTDARHSRSRLNYSVGTMTDPNEISALKASFRGAVATADALHAIRDRIEALDVHAEISAADLDELSRVSTAHALASAALRGLVVTMLTRRSSGAA